VFFSLSTKEFALGASCNAQTEATCRQTCDTLNQSFVACCMTNSGHFECQCSGDPPINCGGTGGTPACNQACSAACIAGGYIGGQCDASGNCRCTGPQPPTPGDPDAFETFINIIFDILLPISIIIGVLLIGRAGYMLMTSQGDPARTQEGKEHLTSAIMGLLFVLLAIGILQTIVKTLIVN